MLVDESPKYMLANYLCFQVTVSNRRQDKRKLGILRFRPTTTIIFRLLPLQQKREMAQATRLRTTSRWIQTTDDLLVALFNNELGMIARDNDEIHVAPGWWSNDVMNALPFDFLAEPFDTAMYDWEKGKD